MLLDVYIFCVLVGAIRRKRVNCHIGCVIVVVQLAHDMSFPCCECSIRASAAKQAREAMRVVDA